MIIMDTKFLGFIDTRTKSLVRHPFLVAFLFAGFYLGEGLLNVSNLDAFWMFVYWVTVVLVGDNFISTYIIKKE